MQGVGFRWFVLHEARALGLSGFVRNLLDGRVEVMAAGPSAVLDGLKAHLERGPGGVRVESVAERPVEELPERYDGDFVIEY